MPKRIQRCRTKGWKMPEGAVSVTRPGKWGNPFRIGGWFKMGNGRDGFTRIECLAKEYLTFDYTLIKDAKIAVDWFREYHKRYPIKESELKEIRGKDLACFCKEGEPCHADVLLELANQ